MNPLERMQIIFESSDLKYKTEPIFEEKTGIRSLIAKKKFTGFKVVENKVDNIAVNGKSKSQGKAPTVTITTIQTIVTELRYISARQIAKKFKMQPREVSTFMEQKGYIKGDKITEEGKLKGLILKKVYR